MAQSRSGKAIKNTITELLLEVVTAVCSFILPRLILSHFGSDYNGITTSISQFIGCVALLKSGIGSVTRAALYKPLAENDARGISTIVNATAGFMRKIAVVFSAAVIVFAAVYPLMVSEEFDWLFAFTLVLIISLSTFFQYFFGLTYQMVLLADQKSYIIAWATIASTVLNTVIAAVLISAGAGIHLVKLGSAVVFTIAPLFYYYYVRRAYHIDRTVPADYSLISQRWDAFGHQIANFVTINTDIIVATIFLNLYEVSVYTIYYMVANAIKKAVLAFSSGITAAFGNIIAKKETDLLKKRFSQFELLICYMSTILLTVTAIMLVPFVTVYTKEVHDVDYYRPVFGYLVCASIYVMCMKVPYEQIVYAAGEFKRTRNDAFIEAGINLGVSVIMVNFWGLNGIVAGTILAIGYRTVRYHLFICRNIIPRSRWRAALYFLFSTVSAVSCVMLSQLLPLSSIHTYWEWALFAVLVSVGVFVIVTALGAAFFQKDMFGVLRYFVDSLKNFVKRGKRSS